MPYVRVSRETGVRPDRPAEPAGPPGHPAALPRVGVVLAAGRSARLSSATGGGSKALLRLGGVPLVERAVRALWAAGIQRVVVVLGYQAGPVGTVISRLSRAGDVRAVRANDWELGNGASLSAARDAVDGEPSFALMTADHVFAEGVLEGFARTPAPAILIDPAPEPAAWEEGCRVSIDGDAVRALGKGLRDPAIDCGAFVVPVEVFERQLEAASDGDHSLAGAMSRLAASQPVRAVPVPPGAWWQDVDTPEDLVVARTRLRRSLTKVSDGPVSRYVNRPLSSRISFALAPLRLAPDLVSVAAAAIGLVAAWFLAVGWGVAGGLLVQAASVADGVDGEVARLQLRASPRGAMLDGVLDRTADAAILAGLGLWALDLGWSPGTVLVLVAAALSGSLLSMATKDRAAALGLPAAPERALGWLFGGRDGRLLIVAVGAIAGWPVAALAAVAATSAVSVAIRVFSVRRLVRPAR
jgi:1L-myo-inositol 1-phosphate cytidylyltransferase / CDP-L-myo-inositol myo-inositolphosphotransferase